MNQSFHYLNTCQFADNHELFAILFALRFENEYFPAELDLDQPISNLYDQSFDRNNLRMMMSLVSLLLGIDIPDGFVSDEWSISELSNRIRTLPRMSDDHFRARLVSTKGVVQAAWVVNYLKENGSE